MVVTHRRKTPSGSTVKVDSDKSNDYQDGYNAAVRAKNRSLATLRAYVKGIEIENNILKRKESLAKLLLSAVAGALLVFTALLCSTL